MKNLFIFIISNILFFAVLGSANAQQTATPTTQTVQIQKPFAIIEGIEAGLVELASMLKVDSLRCSDKSYEIISFSMSFLMKSGDIHEIISKSAAVTPLMKEDLVKENFNKKIWIENIKAKSPNGTIVELASIAITIR